MNKNQNIVDFLDGLLKVAVAEAARRRAERDGVVDAESEVVSDVKYTASMPVKAIFNVKTEELVPALGEDGKPLVKSGRIVKTAKKLDRPVLASKVFFEDGTWTVVKNSGEDTIDLVEVKTPDGRTVVTASDASKERALAYAVVKHAFGKADPDTGEVYGANLGRRFEKVLKASVDQRVSAATKQDAREKREKHASKRACGAAKDKSRGCPSREEVKNLVKDVMLGLADILKNGDKGLDLSGEPAGA